MARGKGACAGQPSRRYPMRVFPNPLRSGSDRSRNRHSPCIDPTETHIASFANQGLIWQSRQLSRDALYVQPTRTLLPQLSPQSCCDGDTQHSRELTLPAGASYPAPGSQPEGTEVPTNRPYDRTRTLLKTRFDKSNQVPSTILTTATLPVPSELRTGTNLQE